MKRSYYPKWFCATYPPRKPDAPPEIITQYEEISRIGCNDYDYIDLVALPEGANCIKVDLKRDYYDETVYSADVIFARKYDAPNPKLNQQTKDYNTRMKEYSKEYAKWKEVKDQWDIEDKAIKADQATREKKHREKLYQKLKKEFDK